MMNSLIFILSIYDDQLMNDVQTIDVVIDETYASDPTAYTASTFLQNLNVQDQSCFAFMPTQSLWRYDKRVQNDTILGKYIYLKLQQQYFPFFLASIINNICV